MSRDEQVNTIIYRYFQSHWYETLRDAEFLASPPTKFNDLFDCAASTTGHVPDVEIDKYLKEHDWVNAFSRIARERGLPTVDITLAALNSGNVNRDVLNIDERLSRTLKTRKTLSKVWRIVCFSESSTDVVERRLTEKRMWKRYADKDRGVRIGVDFSFCTLDPKSGMLGKVKYSEQGTVVDLNTVTLEPNILFNYLKVVLTKKRLWEREREIRLVTTPTFCNIRYVAGTNEEQCFWRFNREIIREVCLGARFPKNQIKGLVKMVRNRYPSDVKICQAVKSMDNYRYEEI